MKHDVGFFHIFVLQRYIFWYFLKIVPVSRTVQKKKKNYLVKIKTKNWKLNQLYSCYKEKYDNIINAQSTLNLN